jgi:hypothetical protein
VNPVKAMNPVLRTRALLLAAALLAAAPLGAQPFDSDVTGALPTGSGIAGMGYPGVYFRDVEGALFRRVDGRSAFRTRAVADAVTGEGAAATQAACAGTLDAPREWGDSVRIAPAAQCALCTTLTRDGIDNEAARRLLHALRGGRPGTPGDAAEVLVAAIAGLARAETSFLDERQRHVAGGRWEQAFRAYEAYLDQAPAEVLDPPAPELLAIGAVLGRLVDAGLDARGR